LLGELEHLKIETRLIDEKFGSVLILYYEPVPVLSTIPVSARIASIEYDTGIYIVLSTIPVSAIPLEEYLEIFLERY
jgi:glyoxylate carboligase